MLVAFLIVAGVVGLALFLILNKQSVPVEREGTIKEILNKDAYAVMFSGDQSPTVVKPFGIALAAENERLDDQIFAFLEERVRGLRVRVITKRVATGNVVIAEIRTLSGEYLNAILVRQGFARWSPAEAVHDSELANAQEAAQQELQGVWNPAVRQLAVDTRFSQGEDGEEAEAGSSEELQDESRMGE